VTTPTPKLEEMGEDYENDGQWLLGCLLDTAHFDVAYQGSFPSTYVELAPLEPYVFILFLYVILSLYDVTRDSLCMPIVILYCVILLNIHQVCVVFNHS
jgi:hypothetical protein